MQFVLRYSGSLPSNGSPPDKDRIRAEISLQLEELWRHRPLSSMPELLQPAERPGSYSCIRMRGGCTFIPLVTAEACGIVDLDILLLRPEPPGNLVTQGGDIDNRMKTLLDALSMPAHESALTKDAKTKVGPTYCLLEDDNLIASLRVSTEQLLVTGREKAFVELLIRVQTRVTAPTLGNSFLG
jgi:hypothetical protein